MNRAPLITAIVLLLLPVLYVGSYLALVTPGEVRLFKTNHPTVPHYGTFYRTNGNWEGWFFWPLERVDRMLRPKAWEL